MTQVERKNRFAFDTNINIADVYKKNGSYLSMYDLANDLTISCTNVIDRNHVTRSTQTEIHEIADLKNVKNMYKDLNKVKYILY